MNCDTVREDLSDYLEQSLDDVSMRAIESHLSSCALCRAEADSLALCIESIASLPTIDPPIGFTQRVMAHLREIEAEPGFWERLWLPLGSKIPIHATAVVLVAVLAVYLFQKQESHNNLLPPPESASSTALQNNQAQSPAPEPLAKVESQDQATAGRTQSSTEKHQPRAGSTTPTKRREPRSARQESAASGQPSSTFTETRRPIGGVIAGTPIMNPAGPRIGAGPFSLPSGLEADSFRVPSSSLARLADYELVVRRRPPGPQDPTATGNIQAVQGNMDRLVATIPDSTRPHVVWVSLAPDQLDQFKRELVTMGTIESESATSYRDLEFASKTGSEVLIRLTILPALEAARSNPAHWGIR